jgi:PAS domain-containing protein
VGAPVPENEQERLDALRRYAILDTLPEAAFDRVAELAASICAAPIALVSLIDSERQWLKAKVGLTLSDTPRDVAFCAHAIVEQDLFVVPDASADERFAANPLVTAPPKIRFYAGAPLITPDGFAVGTLCVLDHVPRHLSDQQQQALRVLSSQVVAQLELRKTKDDLSRARTDATSAGEALRASEEFKSRLVACSRDCIKVLDLEGRLLFMNEGGMEVLEICDVAPFLNSSWVEFWGDTDHQSAQVAVEAARNGRIGGSRDTSRPLQPGSPAGGTWW